MVPVLVLQGLLQVPLQQCASCLQLLNCSGQHRYLELVVWWINWYVGLTKVGLLADSLWAVGRGMLTIYLSPSRLH